MLIDKHQWRECLWRQHFVSEKNQNRCYFWRRYCNTFDPPMPRINLWALKYFLFLSTIVLPNSAKLFLNNSSQIPFSCLFSVLVTLQMSFRQQENYPFRYISLDCSAYTKLYNVLCPHISTPLSFGSRSNRMNGPHLFIPMVQIFVVLSSRIFLNRTLLNSFQFLKRTKAAKRQPSKRYTASYFRLNNLRR